MLRNGNVFCQKRESSREEYFFLSSKEFFYQCDLTNESKFPRRIFLLLKLEAFSINLLKRLSYPIMEASGDLHLHHKMDEPSAMVERGGGLMVVERLELLYNQNVRFSYFAKFFHFQM